MRNESNTQSVHWKSINGGDDIKSIIEIISEKLRWTFQVEKLGDMVLKSAEEGLSLEMQLGNDRNRGGVVNSFYEGVISYILSKRKNPALN